MSSNNALPLFPSLLLFRSRSRISGDIIPLGRGTVADDRDRPLSSESQASGFDGMLGPRAGAGFGTGRGPKRRPPPLLFARRPTDRRMRNRSQSESSLSPCSLRLPPGEATLRLDASFRRPCGVPFSAGRCCPRLRRRGRRRRAFVDGGRRFRRGPPPLPTAFSAIRRCFRRRCRAPSSLALDEE